MAKQAGNNKTSPTVRVRYETTNVEYASQFVVNANQEDITVNCSAGYIADPNTSENLLPIHTRLVLTPSGTKRLIETLNQALENLSKASAATASTQTMLDSGTGAKIPKIN